MTQIAYSSENPRAQEIQRVLISTRVKDSWENAKNTAKIVFGATVILGLLATFNHGVSAQQPSRSTVDIPTQPGHTLVVPTGNNKPDGDIVLGVQNLDQITQPDKIKEPQKDPVPPRDTKDVNNRIPPVLPDQKAPAETPPVEIIKKAVENIHPEKQRALGNCEAAASAMAAFPFLKDSKIKVLPDGKLSLNTPRYDGVTGTKFDDLQDLFTAMLNPNDNPDKGFRGTYLNPSNLTDYGIHAPAMAKILTEAGFAVRVGGDLDYDSVEKGIKTGKNENEATHYAEIRRGIDRGSAYVVWTRLLKGDAVLRQTDKDGDKYHVVIGEHAATLVDYRTKTDGTHEYKLYDPIAGSHWVSEIPDWALFGDAYIEIGPKQTMKISYLTSPTVEDGYKYLGPRQTVTSSYSLS